MSGQGPTMGLLEGDPAELLRRYFPALTTPDAAPKHRAPKQRPRRGCRVDPCPGCRSCRSREAWAAGKWARRRKGVLPDAWLPKHDARLRELAGSRPLPEVAARLSDEFALPRSAEACRIRCVRLGISTWVHGLSMRDVERLFRVDHRAILRWWVEPGLLVGTRWDGRGPEVGWWFEPSDLERFVREHRHAYEAERTDAAHRLGKLARTLHRADPWLDAGALGTYLGVTRKTIQRWAERGLLPEHRRRYGAGGCGRIVVRRSDFCAIARRLGPAIEAWRRRWRAA